MDQGKLTKAKWWSRPQGRESFGPGEPDAPQDTPGSDAAASSDGDFELAAPQGSAEPDGVFERTAPEGPSEPEGDFELRAPEGPAEPDGDFELRAPGGSSGTVPVARTPDGDFELAPPEAVAAEPVTDRPEPTQDTDSSSTDTPPYGVPGPWAPAPPVQHPAATVTPQGGTTTPPPENLPAPADDTAPPPSAPWQNYDPWAPAPFQQTGAAAPTQDQGSRPTRQALLTGAVLLALVAGGVGGAVGVYLERNRVEGGVVELPQAGRESGERAPGTVAGIAARALPSVVTLHVRGTAESGTGTGFVLDGLGHILTNNHVVEPAGSDGEISVTFQSGDTAKATVVGRDSGYDLAVVKVNGVRGLRPLPLGNSDNVQVGDPVVAIGAPFDLEGTVTSGIISAKERPITAGGERGDGSDVSYVDALQTDAPINPGNSGGPLLDSRARVVGINSAIRSAGQGVGSESGQAGSIGLGFAIPVNQAKRVAEELINTGRATHPVIGVTLDMGYTGDGARVGTEGRGGGPAVSEGGPGEKAGLKAGDVITRVDGRPVHSGDELIVRTRAHRPGDLLRLTLERAGREITVTLTLGSSEGS
ncbi:trypsin-like peptidase domain-containing protein [Streptomyces griseorubiginosus]|uniref:trypsin-like peptidase domain-containing protein n=1 Tax=Streptomyces griseorubiginosus TaxID=67304 RepID=UPI00113FE9A1|nr:trypsin-like peptidase domain-containing protein [Streptomyces griseorubiginosus]